MVHIIEFITTLLLFYVWYFGCEAYGILAFQLEIELAPAALEGEVFTIGPPGKSLPSFSSYLPDAWHCLTYLFCLLFTILQWHIQF